MYSRLMPRLMLLFALLFALLLTSGQALAGSITFLSGGGEAWVTVSKVIDGDTFHASNGDKIRLLGINTPEIQHGNKPGQEMGREATRALKSLIGGQSVQLKFDRQRTDDYGRLLAQVWLRDGTWVNGEMIRQGFAHVYTFPPNNRWAAELINLETAARLSQRGIWGTDRFGVLTAEKVGEEQAGEFHVIEGTINKVERSGFGFTVGRLRVTIPRDYRADFAPLSASVIGKRVRLHGVVRSNGGSIFFTLHNPTDLEWIR